jgi:glutathione S-transferase
MSTGVPMTLDPWNIFTATFGQVPKPCTAFMTLMEMALYFILSLNVAFARNKYKVEAPSVDGPIEFRRIFRVQMNMLEQLVFHLPLMWIAAYAMDDVFAASFGSVWLLGRVIYSMRYYKKATRRHKGFVISMTANAILLLGALVGTIASF